MILTINRGSTLKKNIVFEGYYVHEKHGVVTAKETIFESDYVDKNRYSLNGLFRLIKIDEKSVELIVDRYRSMPIFYTKRDDTLIISTDFFELYKEAAKCGFELTIDDIAANNYIRFGYVPHENTIINEIKELPCGTSMKINNSELNIEINKYWEFQYKENKDFNKKIECENLKEIYDSIFKDYCKYINRSGKSINFALSGGLDSRLVLGGIMKFIDDKSKIILNTFGNIYSEDVRIPYNIAHTHGLQLKHFAISEFNNMFNDNEIMTNATQGRSLSHYQDGFPLIEEKKLKRDDIWFFGHTGDFIGGGHISRKVYYSPEKRYDGQFLQLILHKHSFDGNDNKFYKTNEMQNLSKEKLLSELDRWDMENRQSKFIINDCATYRQFDNFVFLPLWDNRLIDFFLKVPLKYKVEKVIYNEVSIEYLKELKLNSYLSKSYYKKDNLFYLIKNKIKLMTNSSDKIMLSHGFNVYFSTSYVQNKVEKIIEELKRKDIKIEKSNTTHFNYYLSLIELNKITNKLINIKQSLLEEKLG